MSVWVPRTPELKDSLGSDRLLKDSTTVHPIPDLGLKLPYTLALNLQILINLGGARLKRGKINRTVGRSALHCPGLS